MPDPLDLAALRQEIAEACQALARNDVGLIEPVLLRIVDAIDALSQRSEWG